MQWKNTELKLPCGYGGGTPRLSWELGCGHGCHRPYRDLLGFARRLGSVLPKAHL